MVRRLFVGALLAMLLSVAWPGIPAGAQTAAAPMAARDPSGTSTGGASDVPVKAAGAPTLVEVMDTVGHNKVAINVMWVLFCGFLVMFMQAGFALVETGFTRAKNVAHTMAMNFMICAVGMIGYWICGFAFQMGGVGALETLGGTPILTHEFTVELFGRPFDLSGLKGFLLSGESMAVYPVYANWVWGGGWLSQLGVNVGLGHGHVDFAGSSVAHMVGGIAALAGTLVIGARIGKFTSDGRPLPISGHHLPMALTGAFILAFGWFGFNAGSTLAGGDLRVSVIAVNTMLSGAAGALTAMCYVWMRFGKPDPSMLANGLVAGLVAITAPCAFVNSVAAVVIGGVAGVLVVAAVLFIEGTLKVDDPVGAVAVHGVNGTWGVLALGLFADGSDGHGLNGVPGGVRGLFYGDASPLAAELVGALVCWAFVFVAFYVFFMVMELIIGNRVAAETEVEGLDMPEMGAMGYPDFVLTPGPETGVALALSRGGRLGPPALHPAPGN